MVFGKIFLSLLILYTAYLNATSILLSFCSSLKIAPVVVVHNFQMSFLWVYLFVCVFFLYIRCVFIHSHESRGKKCTKRDNDDYGVFFVREGGFELCNVVCGVLYTHKTFFFAVNCRFELPNHFNNAIIIVSLCLMWFCVCSIECFVFRWKILLLHVGVIFEKRKERNLYIII